VLVARLAAGESTAYTEAYHQLRPRLFGFLLRLCRNRAVAEELLQDAFVKLALNASKLRPDTELSAWMFTVARNVAMSYRRWAALDASRILLWATRQRSLLTPEEEAASTEGERKLEQAMAKLAYTDREVLLLVGVEALSPQHAAEVLGINDATLRQRLSRARQRLAAALEPS